MAHCGDVVAFDRVYGDELPAIKMRPCADYGAAPYLEGTILRSSDQKTWTEIEIPEAYVKRIRQNTGHKDGEPLAYIASSETADRVLRIHFPTKESLPLIVHVGFTGPDCPGPLSGITNVLQSAGFNIITALLRKRIGEDSQFETLLEYRGDYLPPKRPAKKTSKKTIKTYQENVLNWCKTRLLTVDPSDLQRLFEDEVELCTPEFPRSSSPISLRIVDKAPKVKRKPGANQTPWEEFETTSVEIIEQLKKTQSTVESNPLREGVLRREMLKDVEMG